MALSIVFLLGAVTDADAKRRTAAEELDFANALVDMGFKDYADKLVKGLEDKGDDELVELYNCNVLIRKGQYDEAEAILKKSKAGLPAYKQLTRLALAHFGKGDLKKSGELYDYVFTRYKEPPNDPNERQFYLDAAYIYATIQERSGDDEGSIDAIDRVISVVTNKTLLRQLETKKATLHLNVASKSTEEKKKTEHLDAAKKITDDLFKIPDKYFAEGVSILVRTERMKGRNKRALDLINDYTDMVLDIETAILQAGGTMAMSPMPALRYQKGDIYIEMSKEAKSRGEAANFLQKGYEEFLNVFAKYKGNEWSDKSAVQLFEVSDWAKEKLGIKIEPEGGRERTMILMLESADIKYRGKDFKGAADAYERVLSVVPEGHPKIAEALVNLANCRILGNKGEGDPLNLETRAAVRQLAYRFRKFPEAGDSVLKLAGRFYGEGNMPLYHESLQVFADNFPNHVKASESLFILASDAKKVSKNKNKPKTVREAAKNKALRYFAKIAQDKYKEDQWYAPSLDQLALSYSESGDHANAKETYRKIAMTSAAGMQRARSLVNYAGAAIQLEQYNEGAKVLDSLLKEFEEQEIYQQQLVKQEVRGMSEQIYFMKGAALAQEGNNLDLQRRDKNRAEFIRLVKEEKMDKRMARDKVETESPPAQATKAKWEAALQAWESQLQKFRRDEQTLGASALEGQGAIYMALNDKEKAVDKFKEIARNYKDSPEARRVLYAMVVKSLELGMDDVAKESIAGMLENPEEYSVMQLLEIGRACNENGLFAEGNRIMSVVIKMDEVKEDPITHQHVLMAQVTAANRSGQPEKAILHGEELLKEYPKSGFKFLLKDELAKAYRAKKDYDNAITSISYVFQNAGTNQTVRLRALCELANIQWESGDVLSGEEQTKRKKKAVSTYRYLILGDPPGEEIESVVRAGLKLGVERSKIMSQYGIGERLAERYLDWYNIVPAGEDPYTYQTPETPSDTKTVMEDLIFCKNETKKAGS